MDEPCCGEHDACAEGCDQHGVATVVTSVFAPGGVQRDAADQRRHESVVRHVQHPAADAAVASFRDAAPIARPEPSELMSRRRQGARPLLSP